MFWADLKRECEQEVLRRELAGEYDTEEEKDQKIADQLEEEKRKADEQHIQLLSERYGKIGDDWS